jgi:peptidoglycan/LPS O-acetylase OafA/YrhL
MVESTPTGTSSGKEHFEVLDGLRGSAAFLIVIFHLFNYSFGWDTPLSLVRHAYLAVDFLFGLSGFVVAYAYDDRWTKMSIPQFFRIRLHPLVLVGATLVLLGYSSIRLERRSTTLQHRCGSLRM